MRFDRGHEQEAQRIDDGIRQVHSIAPRLDEGKISQTVSENCKRGGQIGDGVAPVSAEDAIHASAHGPVSKASANFRIRRTNFRALRPAAASISFSSCAADSWR